MDTNSKKNVGLCSIPNKIREVAFIWGSYSGGLCFLRRETNFEEKAKKLKINHGYGNCCKFWSGKDY